MSEVERSIPVDSRTLVLLNEWLGHQLDNWEAWMLTHQSEWLVWPTENERFPTLGHFWVHAFTPLHRYADQLASVEPADDGHLNVHSWLAVSTWARQCIERHREACVRLPASEARVVREFMTRSAGPQYVTAGEALLHGMTHCYWHLGGISHMLRLGHLAPPSGGDLLFFAAARHMAAPQDGPAEGEWPEVG